MDWCDHCDMHVEGHTHEAVIEKVDGSTETFRCCNFCEEPIRTFNEDPDWR